MLTEFDFIERFLTKKHKRSDVVLGIGDDCALLKPPHDQLLAVSTDTLVSGIHFDNHVSAFSLGHKSLATSLSDLAAMGAEPAWVMLSLTIPQLDEKWCEEFCAGFFALLDRYKLNLIGGNTSKGSLNITTQVFGFVPQDQALRRDIAQPGDLIYVTGTLGNAGLALAFRNGDVQLSQAAQDCVTKRLDQPEARIEAGLQLRKLTHAAIDLSDGLIIDLSHILKASSVGATIHLNQLPLSAALQDSGLNKEQQWEMALSAGGDYELCFTVPAKNQNKVDALARKLNCQLTQIGVIEKTPGLRLLDEAGNPFQSKSKGYEHFT